ncbi:MAG: ATP-grasp domain-containing protein [Oligoflexales bacterium]|nr:ATP-grasp domain-containing protein [Oligoflexales bacterium]
MVKKFIMAALSTFAVSAFANPINVISVDGCFLPNDFDLLKGKEVRVDLITSGHPALEYLFSPKVCIENFEEAVKPGGKLVKFKAHFIGYKMAGDQYVNDIVTKINRKRKHIDLVFSVNADRATLTAQHIREYLGMGVNKEKWSIDHREAFYDKFVMKTLLTNSEHKVKTSEFIDFNSTKEELDKFLESINFPENAAIIKKKRSAGAVGITVVKTHDDVKAAMKKIKDPDNYLIERFVVGTSFRFNGTISNDKITNHVRAFHRTSPLEHYQSGKPRITTTIDEHEISFEKSLDFTQRVLKSLGMHSGTYHLEGIKSTEDGQLYFVEIAARPGEGNVEVAYSDLYGYQAKRAFYYQQTPLGFYNSEQEAKLFEEMITPPKPETKEVFAVIAFPFVDANRSSLQKVKTNMDSSLKNGSPELPSLISCSFDPVFDTLDEKRLAGKGQNVMRMAFLAGIKAVACTFKGERQQVEDDLAKFQEKYYFVSKPNRKYLNPLIPRFLMRAGGL